MPSRFLSKHTTIDDLRIHYLEETPQESDQGKTPLLLLAGWPMASFMLTPLIKLIAPYTKCYVLDLPGFGGSESDMDIFCGFDYHLDIIQKFHQRIIKTEKLSLFGYSTGGVHAINYAYKYPQSVEKLISFSAPYDGVEQFAEMEVDSAFRVKTMKRIYPFFTRHLTLVKLINFRVVKLLSIGVFYLVIYMKLYPKVLKTCKKRFILRYLHKTSQFNIKTILDLAIDLSYKDFTHIAQSLNLPVLVTTAVNDKAVKLARSKKLAELIPNSLFYVAEDSDHSVGISEPQKLAVPIVQFLETGTIDKPHSVA
ncbi:alpha/beta hydrolase [Candidatus Woesebacteria bacterium]|nr:alpha/beta hydrolase [Candidatus Woesebacteria bacterium]